MVNSSEIFLLLSSPQNGSDVKKLILNDIKEYRTGRKKKGTYLPIRINNSGNTISISKDEVRNLINFYLKDEIDAVELEYVANMLELCEDFEYNESISEFIFLLSTPEINYELTKNSVLKIKRKLREVS